MRAAGTTRRRAGLSWWSASWVSGGRRKRDGTILRLTQSWLLNLAASGRRACSTLVQKPTAGGSDETVEQGDMQLQQRCGERGAAQGTKGESYEVVQGGRVGFCRWQYRHDDRRLRLGRLDDGRHREPHRDRAGQCGGDRSTGPRLHR